jgi:transposase
MLSPVQEHEEAPMAIVGGFDVHRAQITFDQVDTDSGEVRTGQVRPATRANLRRWLEPLAAHADVAYALEGCTGWRFVAEELSRAGVEVHLAEPADTATLRGKKKRAKTDRADARHLRELLVQDRVPESWVPPGHVLEVRALGRLYVALMDERRQWQQRIHAQLFHQGAPPITHLLGQAGRQQLAGVELSLAGRRVIEVALSVIDHLSAEIDPLRAEITDLGRHQTGCRALMSHYGIGALTAPIIWAEMGDCRRFSSSDKAVRHTGLDITVWSSDNKRASGGHLARQGPPALRWALVEAAQSASRSASPDHRYYLEVKARAGANRAALSVARQLARRTHHTLRALGDAAWAPAG